MQLIKPSNKVSFDIYLLLPPSYGYLDILVNNAGVRYKRESMVPHAVQVESTVRTNYFGARRLLEALLPLLRGGGRVVNVSSGAGLLNKVAEGSQLRKRLASRNLSLEELDRYRVINVPSST